MRACLRYLIIVLSVLGFHTEMTGQQSDYPYSQWAEALSKRSALRTKQYQETVQDIVSIPADAYCNALRNLQEAGSNKNIWFDLHMRLVKGALEQSKFRCADQWARDTLLQNGLYKAYEKEDSVYAVIFHQALVDEYNFTGNYGLAVLHGRLAREIQLITGTENYLGLAMSRYSLGHALYHARDYPLALMVMKEAVHGFNGTDALRTDTLDPQNKMNGYNTIGLCYNKLGQYDSAMVAFHQALAIADRMGNNFWQGLVSGNIGEVYYKTGQWDTARVLLMRDVENSKRQGEMGNAANSMIILARIDAREGRTGEALKKLETAGDMLKGGPEDAYKANLYEAYTLVYKQTGEAGLLFDYMNRFLKVHDSLEQVSANYRTEVIQLRLTNQAAVNRILLLNKQKEKVELIRNFIIMGILLLSVTGYGFLNRQKLHLKLRQQKAEDEKRLAMAEADLAISQLNDYTERLREKARIVDQLEEELARKHLLTDQADLLSRLANHTILTDADWDNFKSLFERVYPGFFIWLRQRYPDMTIGEQRMAALIRLQITAKEAAGLLGIAPNSVIKTRQRLKQRLGLDPDADLESYFASNPPV